MIRAVALLLALAAMPAIAADGFFRHQESRPHEHPGDAVVSADPQPIPCLLVARYNNDRPAAQEISYQGPQASCLPAYVTAVNLATLSKVAGGADPLIYGPPYDCAILVAFDARNPSTTVLTSLLGSNACGATWPSAIAAMRQNVACVVGTARTCAP